MWLVVGLGNPGTKYILTRHNVGFMAVDNFLRDGGQPQWKTECQAKTCQAQVNGEKVIFALPQTYMNKSGESVKGLLHYYDIPQERMIVLHDEIDQPFGGLKLQKARGHGGHNGIRSIHELLGSNDYMRIRIGVGRPANEKMNVADFVLQNFSKEEMSKLPDFLNTVGDSLEAILVEGFDKAATQFNGLTPPS